MKKENGNRRIQKSQPNNQTIYIAVSILMVAIVAFIASFVFYGNYAEDNFEVGRTSRSVENMTNHQMVESVNNTQTTEASSTIGKTVNEISQNSQGEGETTKVAVNTSAKEEKVEKEKKNQEEKKEKSEQTTKKEESEVETTKIEEKVENPVFEKPVEGEISKEYAKEKLVYSNTLKEWTTHNGIDIKAEKTTVVKTAAEGTVKSIKNDPRYGITVTVEHANGFQTIYANLLSTEFVTEGEELQRGQSIGTVGNTATFEIVDDAHLHFEIMKDGEYLDPELYIQ